MNIALPYLYYAFILFENLYVMTGRCAATSIYTRVIISVIDISNGYPVTDNKQTRK